MSINFKLTATDEGFIASLKGSKVQGTSTTPLLAIRNLINNLYAERDLQTVVRIHNHYSKPKRRKKK